VVAATNHGHKLDPAALRRFVFKLELQPLGQELARRAFERFFAMPAPAALAEISNLTPGDFAVVVRQLRFHPNADADAIVEALHAKANAKPQRTVRLGFG
jgi:transitional endoplasmic reticulum ATPase